MGTDEERAAGADDQTGNGETPAVDSVLLGHGTTAAPLDDSNVGERSLCSGRLRSLSTMAAQTSQQSLAPLVTCANGAHHLLPRRRDQHRLATVAINSLGRHC
jgi:hypothetical protein